MKRRFGGGPRRSAKSIPLQNNYIAPPTRYHGDPYAFKSDPTLFNGDFTLRINSVSKFVAHALDDTQATTAYIDGNLSQSRILDSNGNAANDPFGDELSHDFGRVHIIESATRLSNAGWGLALSNCLGLAAAVLPPGGSRVRTTMTLYITLTDQLVGNNKPASFDGGVLSLGLVRNVNIDYALINE